MQREQGFTLIELLVVIAIIGVLSSVVLASLNTARSKGTDSAVRQTLVGMRSQAELYFYANGNSYTGVCGTTAANGVKTINAQAASAAKIVNVSLNVTYTTAGSATTVTCHDTASAWGAEAPLRDGTMFCVDSTGNSATTSASSLGTSDAVCG